MENKFESKLPRTICNIPMPPIDRNTGKCDTCIKQDVCQLKDSFMNAVYDIELIESRTNVFMDNSLRCKKYVCDNKSNVR